MEFLTAEWRKLAIINYEIDPKILEKYLPTGTELDFYDGKCLVSLVGFMFINTKLLGLSIPFYKNFEEVNLRFYVKKKEGDEWKRGVVFIKEIVSKKALSLIANTFYKEHYETLPMKHEISAKENELKVNYQWKSKNWNSIDIIAENFQKKMQSDIEFEFITEHYFGYTKDGNKTTEYAVLHPKWNYYEVKNAQIKVDFKENYGQDFEILNTTEPYSIMLAEGSEVEVHTALHLQHKTISNEDHHSGRKRVFRN